MDEEVTGSNSSNQTSSSLNRGYAMIKMIKRMLGLEAKQDKDQLADLGSIPVSMAFGYPMTKSTLPLTGPDGVPALYHSMTSDRAYIQYPDGMVSMFDNNKWVLCYPLTNTRRFTSLDNLSLNIEFISLL